MKKVGKTTRPFRYDLNQIPYNSIVEVTNRIRSSRQSAKELRMGVLNTVQKAMTKIIPKKKKCKKAKEADQNHPKEKEMQEGKVVI